MSMKFKILWIEDDEDWLDSLDKDIIKSHIRGYGFKSEIEFRSSEEDINMDVDGMLYDLIIIDFHITNNGKNGAEIISSIRESSCLTDVIFYSSSSISVLREEALKKELDGVFFSSRENEHLLFKVCKLFDLNVKHLTSVDNVRGLVMSGVADLDIRLLNIINSFNEKIKDEERLEFRRSIVSNMVPKYDDIKKFYITEDDNLKRTFKDVLTGFNAMEPNVLSELLGNRSFSSFKRIESLQTLCRYRKVHEENKELIGNITYLLKWRNALAHQNPEIIDNIKFFKIGKEKKPFDTDESKKILHQLCDLDDILSGFSARIEAFE